MSGAEGTLRYPHKPTREASVVEAEDQRAMAAALQSGMLTSTSAKKWAKGVAERDGSSWHWNMPYTMKRNVPDW